MGDEINTLETRLDALRVREVLHERRADRAGLIEEWRARGGLAGWDGLMVLGEWKVAREVGCADEETWGKVWERLEEPRRKVAWLKAGRQAGLKGWREAGERSLKHPGRMKLRGVLWRAYYGFRVRWLLGSVSEE